MRQGRRKPTNISKLYAIHRPVARSSAATLLPCLVANLSVVKMALKRNGPPGSTGVETGVFNRKVVRPERVELPTFWFVARRSIQLSYGRIP